MTKFKLLRNSNVRMYGVSAPLCAFLGAGNGTRTRDSLLGRCFVLCAVAYWLSLAYSCGFLQKAFERKMSSYGVVNESRAVLRADCVSNRPVSRHAFAT